jgi:hypothetical protein
LVENRGPRCFNTGAFAISGPDIVARVALPAT